MDEAVAYAIEIGRGLTAAHARKLVHRDVKPQNVLIDPDGRAKVTDFGIARSLEQKGMTATGRVLGTTDYVSPEQAMGEDVDERSDVYSLGVVLYEMLTGDVPFQAETQVGVAMKHVNEPMPDVQAKRPEVSAAVASVVDRSTTKDPRDRYDTVGADGPRPRADPGGRGRPPAAGPAARRPACSTRSPPRGGDWATAQVQARDRDGGHRRRPDRGRVDLRRRRASHLGGSSSPPASGGTEVKLPVDAASEFDPRRATGRETGTERLGDRFATRPEPLGRRSTTTRRTSAASRTASGSRSTPAAPVAREVDRDPQPRPAATTPRSTSAAGSPPSSLSGWGQPVGRPSPTAGPPRRSA